MTASTSRRVAVVLGVFLIIAVGVWHLAAQSSGVINACASMQSGAMRAVSATNQCKSNEIPLSWNVVGQQGPIGAQGPTGLQGPPGPQGPAGSGDIPSSRSHLVNDTGIPPSTFFAIDWNQVLYDTLGAVQLGPWRYVAPTAGRYRVSTFIRYRPNGLMFAGQKVVVEVYVNGNDYGTLGGFQATDTWAAELFIQGEDEVLANAGDQITIRLFQDTGQSGAVTVASHVIVARLGS